MGQQPTPCPNTKEAGLGLLPLLADRNASNINIRIRQEKLFNILMQAENHNRPEAARHKQLEPKRSYSSPYITAHVCGAYTATIHRRSYPDERGAEGGTPSSDRTRSRQKPRPRRRRWRRERHGRVSKPQVRANSDEARRQGRRSWWEDGRQRSPDPPRVGPSGMVDALLGCGFGERRC